MAKRYSYSACLMFGTDGEADHCEIDVTVSYEIAWLDDDGRRGEIEDIRVEAIDSAPAEKADPVAVAEAIERLADVTPDQMERLWKAVARLGNAVAAKCDD